MTAADKTGVNPPPRIQSLIRSFLEFEEVKLLGGGTGSTDPIRLRDQPIHPDEMC